MPQVALAVASTAGLAAFQLGASVAVTNAVVSITAFAVTQAAYAAVGTGINFAASALMGGASNGAPLPVQAQAQAAVPPPQPEDIQQTITSAIAPRIVHFGRVKAGGSLMIADARAGHFYKLIAVNHGEIDAVEEYWIGDTRVNIDGAGLSTTTPYTGRVQFQVLYGTADQSGSPVISAALPEWTSAHRGRGVAQLAVNMYPIESDEFLSVWPSGIHTKFRLVMRGIKVKNPVTSTVAWSDNPAAIIRNYLESPDGMRLPTAILETPQALAGWQAAFNACAAPVALAGGGTEPRWRLWGSWNLSERPGDVLARMLANCNSRLKITRDGGLTMEVITWAEPDVVLDETVITHVTGLSHGRSIHTTANTIKARYLEPAADYQTTDAEPWVDAADVAARGEILADREFIHTPSASQCRRLMKAEYYRANPALKGTFICNLGAMAAFGERFVRFRLAKYSIDAVFEVEGFEPIIEAGDRLMGVRISAISMPEESGQWTPAEEEGDSAVSSSLGADAPIGDVANFGVTLARAAIGETLYPYAVLSFDAPSIVSQLTEARMKKTADSQWLPVAVSPGATSAQTNVLEDGATYEFQARHVSGGRAGDWTTSATLDVVADNTPPGAVSGLSATPSAGEVALAWTVPNSSNYAAANIYRAATNDEGSATLVHTQWASSGPAWTETGLAAGTYYYWVKARNASAVESASVATGAVTVP